MKPVSDNSEVTSTMTVVQRTIVVKAPKINVHWECEDIGFWDWLYDHRRPRKEKKALKKQGIYLYGWKR